MNSTIVLRYLFILIQWYLVTTMVVAAFTAVLQERKIWKPKQLPTISWFGLFKVFAFNILWMVLCLVGSILISLRYLFTFGRSDIQLEANRWVENPVARICFTSFVGKVEIYGTQNLPSEDDVPAPVYVANHASQIDVAAVYYLNRRFKWIAKSSVLYLPGVGQIMWLAGHVLIKRTGKNKKSVNNLYEKSNEAIKNGIPMFFFPQGTRRISERLPFKDGAFIVAEANKSTLIPVSIHIPLNAWNTWYPLSLLWGGDRPTVRLTLHEPVYYNEKHDRETTKRICFDRIYSILPDRGSKK